MAQDNKSSIMFIDKLNALCVKKKNRKSYVE